MTPSSSSRAESGSVRQSPSESRACCASSPSGGRHGKDAACPDTGFSLGRPSPLGVMFMSHLVSAAIDRRCGPVNECAVLSEALLWSSHEATIWKPQRFEGQPHFYPVYRWGELYSYSLLSLILHKGSLHLNPRAAQQSSPPGFVYQSLGHKGRETIDREIMQVGGPLKPGFEIREPDDALLVSAYSGPQPAA